MAPKAVVDSEWVIVALSRAWRDRWEGRNDPTIGAGAVAEANALLSLFARDQKAFGENVVLVTLPSCRGEDIVPTGLDGVQRFRLEDFSREELDPLIALLTRPGALRGGAAR